MEKTSAIKHDVWLGFDLGSKSLGIALRNRLGMIIPLKAWFFSRFDMNSFKKKISELVEEYEPTICIFGIPYQANGTMSKQTLWVQGVIAQLKNHLSCSLATVDERYTTLEAQERLHALGLNSKVQKAYVDSLSAYIILEQYERQPR